MGVCAVGVVSLRMGGKGERREWEKEGEREMGRGWEWKRDRGKYRVCGL